MIDFLGRVSAAMKAARVMERWCLQFSEHKQW